LSGDNVPRRHAPTPAGFHGRTRAAHLVSLCASGLLVLVAAVCKTLKGIEGYDEIVCTLGRRGRAEGRVKTIGANRCPC
jgi:hypothetical protein